jgi:hypothetical protein
MSNHDAASPIARKDFYRALTVLWSFMWFLAMSLHNPVLWSTGLLLGASMAMVVIYAVQVLQDEPQRSA